MKLESHIFNYCLCCKNFNPNKTTEIQAYCNKFNSWIENYHVIKCRKEKYFEEKT